MHMRRRDLLGSAAALAAGCATKTETAGPAWAPRPPRPADWPDALPEDAARFDLGVASGDPRPDGVVAWAHSTSADPVTFVVVVHDGASWVAHAELEVVPNDGGFAKATVEGLPPDTWYAFQARSGGVGSAVGYGRTAPDADAEVEVTLGAVSCLHADHGDFPAIGAVLAMGPVDAFLQLGDTVYADGSADIADYRASWAQSLGFSAMRNLGSSAPQIHTWDDHEIANDWTQDGVSEEQLAAGTAAFFENVPIRQDPAQPTRIWRSFRFGRTVEVFVLDCRSERDASTGRYLSDAQLQWLLDGLAASPCAWKVVQNSVPIADLPLAFDASTIIADRWEGFPEQRAELIESIVAAGVTGVVFVSGDVHFPAILRVDPEGGAGHAMFDVLVGPGGSIPVPVALLYDEVDPWIYRDAFYGAGRLVFTPDGRLRIQQVGEDGTIWADVLVDAGGSVLGASIAHTVD
jgi:phosphodiesterase/alkaline phosphatase D-like protein